MFPRRKTFAYFEQAQSAPAAFILVRSQMAETPPLTTRPSRKCFAARYVNAGGSLTALHEAGRCLNCSARSRCASRTWSRKSSHGDPPTGRGHRRRQRAHATRRDGSVVAELRRGRSGIKIRLYATGGWSHRWSRVGGRGDARQRAHRCRAGRASRVSQPERLADRQMRRIYPTRIRASIRIAISTAGCIPYPERISSGSASPVTVHSSATLIRWRIWT